MKDGEKVSVEWHVQNMGPDGPSPEDLAIAYSEEFGPGPITVNTQRQLPPEKLRALEISDRLETAAGLCGWGAVSLAVLTGWNFFHDNPDIYQPTGISTVVAVVAMFALAHARMFIEERDWESRTE